MMQKGLSLASPYLDVEIELYDGAFHAVDSSAVAFELPPGELSASLCAKAGPSADRAHNEG